MSVCAVSAPALFGEFGWYRRFCLLQLLSHLLGQEFFVFLEVFKMGLIRWRSAFKWNTFKILILNNSKTETEFLK